MVLCWGTLWKLISRVKHCKDPAAMCTCAPLHQGLHRAQEVELKVLSASVSWQNLPYPAQEAQEQRTTPALLHSKSCMKWFGLDYLNFTKLWPHLPRPRTHLLEFVLMHLKCFLNSSCKRLFKGSALLRATALHWTCHSHCDFILLFDIHMKNDKERKP